MSPRFGMGNSPEAAASPAGAEKFSDWSKGNALRQTEQDYINHPGYRRKYRPDGSYEWKVKLKVKNADGTPSREFQEDCERMRPFIKASAEYQQKWATPKVALKDKEGAVRFVEPALADASARRNGWSLSWRAGGLSVEGGPGGMLFRLAGNRWEPVGEGRWCLGEPWAGSKRPADGKPDGTMRRLRPQTDPDGEVWEWDRKHKRWTML